ncbi:MAG: hypothetical protein D6734_12510 [Candidatus Schekmanbacteria bacterium]|nr:MAG: hypothetical protein D6734_12510 [Candidatus Schekmanbacteria bacterium]
MEMKKPDIKEMPIEEKWDRLHDFFTMDHAISYKTHKRLGTVQEWVDDTVEAYRYMAPRFIGPMARIVGKLAPNKSLKEAIKRVLYNDQMMHGPGEYEVSEPENGEITVRFKNCLRLKKQREIVKKANLGFDGREICEVEKMHLTHPRHPTTEMGCIPIKIEWEETGCVWTFKMVK